MDRLLEEEKFDPDWDLALHQDRTTPGEFLNDEVPHAKSHLLIFAFKIFIYRIIWCGSCLGASQKHIGIQGVHVAERSSTLRIRQGIW